MNIDTDNQVELIKYEFKTKKGTIKISFEDVSENPKFIIQGPKEVVSKAIAGIGEENENEAWATQEHLETEAKRMYAILEALKISQEML